MEFTAHDVDEYLEGFRAAARYEPLDSRASEAWRDGWRQWHLYRFMRREKSGARRRVF